MSRAARAEPFTPAARAPIMQQVAPVTSHLKGYRPRTLRHDVVAGLTVAAIAVPMSMAYAEVAGLPAVNGLYALLLPALAYAVLGSSRQLSVGPDGTLAALVGAAAVSAAAGGADPAVVAATIAVLTGACFVAAWLLRLGFVADYVSRPVLIGYVHGIAAVLVIGQLGKLLGVDVTASEPIPQLVEVAREVSDVHAATFVVGAASLAAVLMLRAVAPRIPAALVVLVLAIAASAVFGLADAGVAVLGEVPAGLPSIDVPAVSIGAAIELLPAALGIFFVALADGVLTARSYAGRHGQTVDVRQELRGLGAANFVAGFSHGMPVGASASRTAMADAMGARTQVAGLIAAAAVAAVLLLLTGPIADLPTAALGAVIIAAAIGLVDLGAWRSLWTTDRVELTIAAVTISGVLVTGVLDAIAFAIGLSIVDVARRSARPHDAVLGWVERLGRYGDVAVHPTARVTPGVVVYRLDDRLFFANADYVKGRVQEAIRGASTPTRRLVFDAEGVNHVDAAGLAALEELSERLSEAGIELDVARMKSHVEAVLHEAGLVRTIGAARFHGTVRQAVSAPF